MCGRHDCSQRGKLGVRMLLSRVEFWGFTGSCEVCCEFPMQRAENVILVRSVTKEVGVAEAQSQPLDAAM